MSGNLDSLLAATSYTGDYDLNQPHASTSNTQDGTQQKDEQEADEDFQPKKRGRRGSAGGSEKRKEQNRAAQRTFRVRKDQHLRALEEQVEEMTGLYKASFDVLESLFTENVQLHNECGDAEPEELADQMKGTILEPLYAAHLQAREAPTSAVSNDQDDTASVLSTTEEPAAPAKRRRKSKYDVVPNPTGLPSPQPSPVITAAPTTSPPISMTPPPTTSTTNARLMQAWMKDFRGPLHPDASQTLDLPTPAPVADTVTTEGTVTGRLPWILEEEERG